jgi:hypothetical protein
LSIVPTTSIFTVNGMWCPLPFRLKTMLGSSLLSFVFVRDLCSIYVFVKDSCSIYVFVRDLCSIYVFVRDSCSIYVLVRDSCSIYVFSYAFWCPTWFPYHMMFVSYNRNTTGVPCGAGRTANPSEVQEIRPVFSGVRLARS